MKRSKLLSRLRCCCMLVAVFVSCSAARAAEIQVVDDAGRILSLAQPAQRIISLTPHMTELLFAAGAGGKIVGTVEYSNFPAAAQRIARIGDNAQLDLERIVALKPDLVVVWQYGNAQRQLDKLLRLGIPVYYNEPRRLPDIARAIEQLGRLAGTEDVARQAAQEFAGRLADLRRRYASRAPVTLFYQIWDKPLMTVNGAHLISDVIRLCGGRNVFSALKVLTPVISTEAVLAADPEAIGGGSAEPGGTRELDGWKKWSRLTAVARGNLFLIHADIISRNTPRILDGAQHMCEALDKVRAKRR
ncbi:MAG: cobalamin-binding protein [Burkholderiales bacterium]|nr:cobalamin-binding protein [Burkholderiales bacterium]